MTGELFAISTAGEDQASLESLRETGFVPWSTFEREQRWREELQQVLDDTFRPPGGRRGPGAWAQSPEAVAALRKQIADLLAEVDRQERRVAIARKRTDDYVQQMQSAIAMAETRRFRTELPPAPLPGSLNLRDYLRHCEKVAYQTALDTSPDLKSAAAALGVGRSTFHRRTGELGLRLPTGEN